MTSQVTPAFVAVASNRARGGHHILNVRTHINSGHWDSMSGALEALAHAA